MSGVPSLPAPPGAPLALPLWARGGAHPGLRAALGLALLALAVLALLVATGTVPVPGAGAAPAEPARRASSRGAGSEAELARRRAQRRAAQVAAESWRPSDRVVPPTRASALFAQHSWYVRPPPPPPAAPPPPPEPTAPPLPYAFVGSFAPQGDKPVYFLARGDRVIDAHVGDRLDGVYQLESAAGGQLEFLYLPLNIRQRLAAGVSR